MIGSPKGNSTLGILCLITATVAAFQVSLFNTMSLNNNVKRARILSARDALNSHIRTYSSLGATFRSSMHPSLSDSVNPELRNCVFGTGGYDCQAGVATPVSLYYPMSSTDASTTNELAKITGPGAIGSNAADPVFYDNKGLLCELKPNGAVKEPTCPFFEVSTTFEATCAGGAPSCPTAQSISVTYMIQSVKNNAGDISFPIAKVESASIPVPRVEILPATVGASGKPGLAGNNVTVTLITTTTTTLSLEAIREAVIKAGIKGEERITNLTNSIFNAGLTDLSKIPFLAKVKIADSKWIRLVMDSGITDVTLATNLYWTDNEWTPELLRDSVKAVDFLPSGSYVAFALASRLHTDPVEAKRIVDSMAHIDNEFIVGGIIRSGFYNDTEKISKVVEAVSEVKVPQVAGAVAAVGVTDKNIANQNAEIVDVIKDKNVAGNIIVHTKGNVAKTQTEVDSYSDTKTDGIAGIVETPNETVAPVAAPATVSLVPTCNNCTKVTY